MGIIIIINSHCGQHCIVCIRLKY